MRISDNVITTILKELNFQTGKYGLYYDHNLFFIVNIDRDKDIYTIRPVDQFKNMPTENDNGKLNYLFLTVYGDNKSIFEEIKDEKYYYYIDFNFNIEHNKISLTHIIKEGSTLSKEFHKHLSDNNVFFKDKVSRQYLEKTIIDFFNKDYGFKKALLNHVHSMIIGD